jgi:hypothetical protein
MTAAALDTIDGPFRVAFADWFTTPLVFTGISVVTWDPRGDYIMKRVPNIPRISRITICIDKDAWKNGDFLVFDRIKETYPENRIFCQSIAENKDSTGIYVILLLETIE